MEEALSTQDDDIQRLTQELSLQREAMSQQMDFLRQQQQQPARSSSGSGEAVGATGSAS